MHLTAALFLLCSSPFFSTKRGSLAAEVSDDGRGGAIGDSDELHEPQLNGFHADSVQAVLAHAVVMMTTTNITTSSSPSPSPIPSDQGSPPAPEEEEQQQHEECRFPYESCSPRHAEEKARLMQRLDRKQGGKWTVSHPRWRLLKAIDGFRSYERVNRADVKRWRDGYALVSAGDRAILEKATDYKRKLNDLEHHISTNAVLAGKIATHAMEFYGVSEKELNEFIRAEEKAGRASERWSVVQAMKHYVRDWSVEGVEERDAAFPCILGVLEGVSGSVRAAVLGGGAGEGDMAAAEGDEEGERKLSVLLPGAGLGRLGHEIAALGGFEVTINEWSTYMIAAYRYLEAHFRPSSPDYTPITFRPFIDSLSHHATNANLFRKITLSAVPSSNSHSKPGSSSLATMPLFSQVLLAEGDFTTVFPSRSSDPGVKTYDVIITHYFIDTAQNLMSYLTTIHALLSPGGAWINFGPLLYGTGPWVQLSLDEVVLVSEALGFEFEDLSLLHPPPPSSGVHEKEGTAGGGDGEHVCGQLTFPDAVVGSGMSKVRGRFSGYGFDERALTRNAYRAQAWVARKKRE